MASSPRILEREREEERRLNLRTLTIASAASAAAAAVTSQLWIAGTWIAAALTPVLVALISEAMHRPTERIVRARTTSRPQPRPSGAGPAPPPAADGPVRVYRQPGGRPPRRRIAIGVVAATAAIACVIGLAALTTVDLVSGGSVGKGSGRLTLGGGGDEGSASDREDNDSTRPADRAPDEPAEQPPPAAEQPAETAPEAPPSDTAPVPPPSETPPGEPLPEPAP